MRQGAKTPAAEPTKACRGNKKKSDPAIPKKYVRTSQTMGINVQIKLSIQNAETRNSAAALQRLKHGFLFCAILLAKDPFIYLFTWSVVRHLCIHWFIRLFVRSFIHSFIHSFIPSLILSKHIVSWWKNIAAPAPKTVVSYISTANHIDSIKTYCLMVENIAAPPPKTVVSYISTANHINTEENQGSR